MRKLLIVGFLFVHVCLHAQDTTVNTANDSSTGADVEAQFPGGQQGWFKFLNKNVHMDVPSQNNAPIGKYTVTVSFLVDTTGKISHLQVEDNPGYGTAEDVLKAFKHSPNWIPATKNGKPVIYREVQHVTYMVTQQ